MGERPELPADIAAGDAAIDEDPARALALYTRWMALALTDIAGALAAIHGDLHQSAEHEHGEEAALD